MKISADLSPAAFEQALHTITATRNRRGDAEMAFSIYDYDYDVSQFATVLEKAVRAYLEWSKFKLDPVPMMEFDFGDDDGLCRVSIVEMLQKLRTMHPHELPEAAPLATPRAANRSCARSAAH